jgi:hypothetical protein
MKTNAYLRFSIAIFPVNVSWQYKLFKRYRFGVFTKTEHIFEQDNFSKRSTVQYTKKHWYIIAKQLDLGLT